jgi:type III pantothenate kinase
MGGFEGDELKFVSRVVTQPRRTSDQYAVETGDIMRLYSIDTSSVDGAVISSVVPELTGVMQQAVKMLTGVDALIVGPGVKSGIHILIDNPAQLGADIVACAAAAADRGRLPCIIYDMGTATTVSVLDSQGRFIGAVICAGVGTTLDMFTSRTALLPHVSIEAPKRIIGKNTIHSMQSGLIYGTASMLDGIAERIEEEIGERAHIIATGGMAQDIVKYCKKTPELCDHLLLEGLKLIYEKNNA